MVMLLLLFIVLGYSVIIPYGVDEDEYIYWFYLLITAYYLWRAFAHFVADFESLDNTYIMYNFVCQ